LTSRKRLSGDGELVEGSEKSRVEVVVVVVGEGV
jgi:hypothetical protein